MTWPPPDAKPLVKVRPGQIVFLRAKVIGTTSDGVALQLVTKAGLASEHATRYVTEDQIVTMQEAIKAVKG